MPLADPRSFSVCFAGAGVRLLDHTQVGLHASLAVLFAEHLYSAPCPVNSSVALCETKEQQLCLEEDGVVHFSGYWGVSWAAALYDRVIYHLLRDNESGLALHAGAVQSAGQVLILPGCSGSGKTTLTARLVAAGAAYGTDELVLVPFAREQELQFFRRPLQVKPGSVPVVRPWLHAGGQGAWCEDSQGMIVLPAALHPQGAGAAANPSLPSPSPLLLFPLYEPGAGLQLETLRPGQAGTLLMASVVNARNFTDHGFGAVMDFVRTTPAYRLRFSDFAGLEDALSPFFSLPAGA